MEHNLSNPHNPANPPSSSTLISSFPMGRGAELRIELLAYTDKRKPQRVISLRVYVPGKGINEAGKMFPVKNGLAIQEFNLQRVIAGLIKARELMASEDETPTKVLSCGSAPEASTGFQCAVALPSDEIVKGEAILDRLKHKTPGLPL